MRHNIVDNRGGRVVSYRPVRCGQCEGTIDRLIITTTGGPLDIEEELAGESARSVWEAVRELASRSPTI